MAPSKPKSQSWKIEAGVAPLSGIGKQKSTMSPHQQRLLEALRKAQVQVERASRRDGVTDTQIAAIIQAQLPRVKRLQRADDIIENSSDLASLQAQVATLHQHYLALAATAAKAPHPN